jgi:hypothetical protein
MATTELPRLSELREWASMPVTPEAVVAGKKRRQSFQATMRSRFEKLLCASIGFLIGGAWMALHIPAASSQTNSQMQPAAATAGASHPK